MSVEEDAVLLLFKQDGSVVQRVSMGERYIVNTVHVFSFLYMHTHGGKLVGVMQLHDTLLVSCSD